jgi:hypothetical protein
MVEEIASADYGVNVAAQRRAIRERSCARAVGKVSIP